MNIFGVFDLLGGLALFLFGMELMSDSLEKQAGGQLQTLLARVAGRPLRGFLCGLAVTAVIQSSSATTVMVVGFVNSGIMTLHQAAGIIMGANVGTTATAWLLSLSGLQGSSFLVKLCKPSHFSPLFAFAGILLAMFAGRRNERKRNAGLALLGFAILMTGMGSMSRAMEPLGSAPWFGGMLLRFSNPIAGILAGAVLTAVIQSSSASVGILQALSATGAVTYGSAIPIILGQNIGTCATAMISSVGAGKNARRAALVHLYFNLIGTAVCCVVFYGVGAFYPPAFTGSPIDAAGIAVVHTAFNIAATLLMLPFARALEHLALVTIPDDDRPDPVKMLDERLLATPAVAVQCARDAACEMAELARMNLLQAISLTHSWNDGLAHDIAEREKAIDRVFERFYRVDKSRSRATGGTGLGLAIVKHIAQIHHAELQLESTLGKGTSITVRFPA